LRSSGDGATKQLPSRDGIVSEELISAGTALPWIDAVAFARRAIEVSLADYTNASARSGWVLFDRSFVDVVSALEHEEPGAINVESLRMYPYHRQVFLVPPWASLFGVDNERRHSFADAVAEYDRLLVSYSTAGYEASVLPKVGVAHRTDLLETYLANATPARNP